MLVAVNTQPRTSLARVLEDLGTTVLELVRGDPNCVDDIGGIVLHDPIDESDLPRGALVLGIGLSTPEGIVEVLDHLGERDAAGMIVRAPVSDDPRIAAAVDRTGVALLGLTPGASWVQLTAMLRTLLAVDSVGVAEAESLGGIPSGDLFALANAVASLLDAPITIEDRSSRVLAYSGRQDEADQPRIATILGRQVPEPYTRRFQRNGVFRELYRSDWPIFIDADLTDPAYELPRVAMAVRAGDEVLGSMWAVVREPLPDDRMHVLADAAKVVALHMLHVRAGADVERRVRADLVSTALEGGVGAREALSRLGLAGGPVLPMALTTRAPAGGPDAGVATERRRLADAFAMHLTAMHPRCTAALVGDVVYGLLAVGRDGVGGEERAVRIATEFLRRIGDHGQAVIGIGLVANEMADLPYARISADRVLRVLRSRRHGGPVVARLSDVHIDALILELRDLVAARGERVSGPVARLHDYDAEHNGQLVETLRAWLDAFGDVVAAAAAVGVHPNTFRYRLRRVSAISGLDLNDPESRFAAMVQLRVINESLEA